MQEHRLLLIAVCLTAFLSSFMGSSINVAMPFIAKDYETSPESITWIINAFTATTSSFLLCASALANRFGYLRMFILGCLISAIFSVAVALAPNLLSSSILRVFQGVGFAILFCTSMALVSQRIPKEQRAEAIGYTIASVYSGLTFSPIIAGFIVESLGWQTMFYITALGTFLSIFLAKSHEQYDIPHSNELPLGKMMLTFLLGMTLTFTLSYFTSDLRMLFIFAGAVLVLIIYLVWEYRSAQALMPIAFILSNKVLSFALCASLFHYMASFIFILLIAMHLQLVLGYPPTQVGFMLLLQPVMMVVFSSISGKVSKKISPQYLTIIGMTCCTFASIIMIFLRENSSIYIIFLAQIIMGIGFGLFSAPNTVIVMNAVNKSQYAMASAVQAISRTAGQAVSMAILTAIMHYLIIVPHAHIEYTHQLSNAIHYCFESSLIAYSAGFICCFLSFFYRHQEIKKQAHTP